MRHVSCLAWGEADIELSICSVPERSAIGMFVFFGIIDSVRVRYPSLADIADMHLAVRNAKGQMDNGDVKAHCYSSPKGWPFIGCPSEHHSTASVPR